MAPPLAVISSDVRVIFSQRIFVVLGAPSGAPIFCHLVSLWSWRPSRLPKTWGVEFWLEPSVRVFFSAAAGSLAGTDVWYRCGDPRRFIAADHTSEYRPL